MQKITAKLALLSVYRPEEIPLITARFFLISTAASLGAVLVGIFFCPDMLSTMLVFAFALLLHDVTIEKQLGKVYGNVLKECSTAISAIEQEYLRTGSIADALEIRGLPKLMKRPIADIHDAVTGADGEAKLQRFMSATPFRPLKTLAIVSYNLASKGDSADERGISGFVVLPSSVIGRNKELDPTQTIDM